MHLEQFITVVWDFYRQCGRTFSWRATHCPYHIVVSEIMLQQTQTYRVEPKYEQFIATLPTLDALADASLNTVLSLWQGLGYNRRAKYLHELAQRVVAEYDGVLPDTPEQLITFSGIGRNTAASICAFAHNKPIVFIETNIRTVFIYSFFRDNDLVSDNELLPLIEQTLDHQNPREWYYALMDYGVHLKKQFGNPARRSLHRTKQSTFEGSDRQIRGAIIRLLTKNSKIGIPELLSAINRPKERVVPIMAKLLKEGLIISNNGIVYIE
jgi:A/G-specific adenine glycosylase